MPFHDLSDLIKNSRGNLPHGVISLIFRAVVERDDGASYIVVGNCRNVIL